MKRIGTVVAALLAMTATSTPATSATASQHKASAVADSFHSPLESLHPIHVPARLGHHGSFAELRHPWYNLVRRVRIEKRTAAAVQIFAPAGAPAHFSATGFEGCVMKAESGGVPTAWYPGHTDGSLPAPYYSGAEGLFGDLLTTWQGLGLGWPQGASYAPAKVQIQGFWKLYNAQGTAPWNGDGCAGGTTYSTSAIRLTAALIIDGYRHHRHHRHHNHWAWLRGAALAWARAQAGKPYEWGGTGPYGFDCSGLVYAAYRAKGFYRLGRATTDMLAQAGVILKQVWGRPARGDLAFFGSGHVELLLSFRKHRTFGAQQPGTNVGRHTWSGYFYPTMFFEIV